MEGLEVCCVHGRTKGDTNFDFVSCVFLQCYDDIESIVRYEEAGDMRREETHEKQSRTYLQIGALVPNDSAEDGRVQECAVEEGRVWHAGRWLQACPR